MTAKNTSHSDEVSLNIKVMEVNVHETQKQCRISIRMKFRNIYDKLQLNNAPDTCFA